ncbi:MAG: alcohol dehydrogenase catalytic domain-containing protein [Frankiaceae bacterium]
MTISHAVPPVSLASVLYGVHDVRLQERPTPRPGPREVLVEVRAVGVCGSDVHYYSEGRIGRYVVESPLVLGHEAAGVVVATGAEAHRHVPGARVATEPGVPCLRCRECRTGHYNLCAHLRFFATPPVDGAFARYVTIHEDFAHQLPDSVDDNAGALLEPLSVAVWAAWKADIRTGDSVLVTGAGPVGLLTVQVARASGATEIVVSDLSAPRLALAARLGATQVIDSSRERVADAVVGADVLIECAGHPAAVAEGLLAVARPDGQCSSASGPLRSSRCRYR